MKLFFFIIELSDIFIFRLYNLLGENCLRATYIISCYSMLNLHKASALMLHCLILPWVHSLFLVQLGTTKVHKGSDPNCTNHIQNQSLACQKPCFRLQFLPKSLLDLPVHLEIHEQFTFRRSLFLCIMKQTIKKKNQHIVNVIPKRTQRFKQS